jgi:hypothetical protein
MRSPPESILSLLAFAAAAGVLWAIVWGGIAFIVVFENLFGDGSRNWTGAGAGGGACLLVASVGAAAAFGSTHLERHLRSPRPEARGFDVLPIAGRGKGTPS